MDSEPLTAKSVARTYMIEEGTFTKNYKDVLSNFRQWDQKEHAADWVLLSENIGPHLGIDETSYCGEVYTFLHNKDGHGKKGTIVAIVKGVKPDEVCTVLNQLPEDKRRAVEDVTMDLSECMSGIVRQSFPNAEIVRDCFHVIQRSGEGIEEIRLHLKREAIKEQKREKAEHQKKLLRLAKRRTAYRKTHPRPKGKKRGRKPQRLNTRFVPSKQSNGETLVDSLTKCRRQMQTSRNKWNDRQEERAKILFEKYPKLKEAYDICNALRVVFRNHDQDKETAKVKLHEWYDEVTKCTLREMKAVKDTIKSYEDEILNYFKNFATNASAESLNSKTKAFRSMLRGVRDLPFFFYRLSLVFG